MTFRRVTTIVMRFSLFFIAAAFTGDLVRPVLFFFQFTHPLLQPSILSICYIINYFSHITFYWSSHQCVIATVSSPSDKTARRLSLLTPRDDYKGVNCENPCRAPYCDWSRVTRDDLQATILKIDPSKSYCLTSDASSKTWNHQWWHAQSCGPGHATIGMRTTVSMRIFSFIFLCLSFVFSRWE